MRKLGIKDLPRIVLGLYVLCMLAGVLAFAVVLTFNESSFGSMMALLVVAVGGVALQVAFVCGCGFRDLCQPIGRARLFLPVMIGALMMAVMASGAFMSLRGLCRSDRTWPTPEMAAFLLSGVAFAFWAQRVPRFGAMGRMGILILVAAILELLFAGASYAILSGRPDCGGPGIYGIVCGAFGVAWAGGVGIVWLFFLLPRYLEEKRSREGTGKPSPD